MPIPLCARRPLPTPRAKATAAVARFHSATSPPVAPTVSVSPDPAYTGDSFTCSASGASDPDGDSLTTSYSWDINGVTVGSSSSLSASTSKGDTVTCTVTVDDGSTTSSAGDSVSISNTAPSVDSISLSPSTVYTNDTVTATASTSDADSDSLSLTYTWYVDGSLVQSGSSSSLSGSSYLIRGSITVTVIADDGTDTGSSSSSALTVSNTDPQSAQWQSAQQHPATTAPSPARSAPATTMVIHCPPASPGQI